MILCFLHSPDVKDLTQTPLIWQGELVTVVRVARVMVLSDCIQSLLSFLFLSEKEGQHWHREHRWTAPQFNFSKCGKSKDGAARLILSECLADLTADYWYLCLQLQEDQSLNWCSGPSRAVCASALRPLCWAPSSPGAANPACLQNSFSRASAGFQDCPLNCSLPAAGEELQKRPFYPFGLFLISFFQSPPPLLVTITNTRDQG